MVNIISRFAQRRWFFQIWRRFTLIAVSVSMSSQSAARCIAGLVA
jgi:hypothetical protein